ncbi:hypothetical protein [Rhizobium hidalgonense]|uniref:hypothetical protein n=1 Tax=Rhizobium hidalgonense TaxID=1538159 RepID=UPI001570818A|nr:hypothetical protein [Rhizobium hidalgonense]QKK27115.1 hypothetical protein FFM81_028145 [Rhizobium hidalgonense]
MLLVDMGEALRHQFINNDEAKQTDSTFLKASPGCKLKISASDFRPAVKQRQGIGPASA